MIDIYSIDSERDHLMEFRQENKKIVCPVSAILEKLVYIKHLSAEMAISPPNLFEKE